MPAERLRVWAVVCADEELHYADKDEKHCETMVRDLDVEGTPAYQDCGPHRVAELVEVERG